MSAQPYLTHVGGHQAEYRTYRAHGIHRALGAFEVRTDADPRQAARDYWGDRVKTIEPVEPKSGRTS